MSKYKLIEKVEVELNKFKVTIVADSNDADYITETDYYSKGSFEEYILDGLIELKNSYSGRHQLKDYPNEYDLTIPHNGWDGFCHTLEELIVEYIDANGKVWSVEF